MTEIRLIRCAACGTTNRVPMEEVERGLSPVCGRCKARMAIDVRPSFISDATYEAEVVHSPLPVLLDLWAPWCGPCRMVVPVLEVLAREWAGRVRIAKLNVDENPLTASRFGVRSIPTLLLLKEGREVDRIVGVVPQREIERYLERLMQ